jgi:hypothetical protein
MKKMSLMALLFGAALFIGLGTTSALAEEGKCGAEKKEMTPGKCGAEKKEKASKCSGEKKADKCGAEKKEKAGKCGAGKCGK